MKGADRTNSQQLLEGCGGVVPPNTPFELIHEKKGKGGERERLDLDVEKKIFFFFFLSSFSVFF
jgi:hypothetical protein